MGFFDFGDNTAKRTAFGCSGCPHFHGAEPSPGYHGKGRLGILLVGEYPSQADMSKGGFMVGPGGEPLRIAARAAGLNLDQDCWTTWAVRCPSRSGFASGSAESPTSGEGGRETALNRLKTGRRDALDCCSPKLLALIKELRPKVVVLLGPEAITAAIMHRLTGRIKGTKPSEFYGECIPDRELNCWLCPTTSPRLVSREETPEVAQLQLTAHLQAATRLAREEVSFPSLPDKITVSTDPAQAVQWIKEARRCNLVAFDYETTGIKPQAKGHKIISAAIAFNGQAYAFPFHQDPAFRTEWKKLMLSPNVGLVAHKADYEWNWTHSILGYWPRSLEWDTCLGAHCLNNQGKTGLKFHTYTKLGVLGYDEQADQYIRAATEEQDGCNAKNRMEQCPIDMLLQYNALDALYTLALRDVQVDLFTRLPDNCLTGFRFYMQADLALIRAHANGLCINQPRIQELEKELTEQIRMNQQALEATDEGKQAPLGLQISSDKQLADFLYGTLGYPKPQKGSLVDKNALQTIGTPFCKCVLEDRRLKKVRDTYLAQYKREAVDGVLHPFFNLHLVRTFRSSSDSPNFQNIPKRDKVTQALIRSMLKPRPGCRLVEYDYKSIEVCISACYHKDPAMITYIKDPTTDMHRDTAADLFLRKPEDVPKVERQAAKNGFVFPAFYGSTSRSMGPAIWAAMKQETRDHLAEKGLTTEARFCRHVEEMEDKFWNQRFRVYQQWRQDTWAQYKRTGYVDLYTGFRCYGPLSFTEATNYSIQGSASHCLLWTMLTAGPQVEGLSGRSRFLGQIHDAIVAEVHPEEEEAVDLIMKRVGTQELVEHWPWIIVPLSLEKDRSEVDGSWAVMESCGLL